jgi:hypothetical protein
MVLNTSTSGSGQIPSMEATTAAFTQSVTGPPFSLLVSRKRSIRITSSVSEEFDKGLSAFLLE